MCDRLIELHIPFLLLGGKACEVKNTTKAIVKSREIWTHFLKEFVSVYPNPLMVELCYWKGKHETVPEWKVMNGPKV